MYGSNSTITLFKHHDTNIKQNRRISGISTKLLLLIITYIKIPKPQTQKKTNNSNNTSDTHIPKIPNLNKSKISPTHCQSNSRTTTVGDNDAMTHISLTIHIQYL